MVITLPLKTCRQTQPPAIQGLFNVAKEEPVMSGKRSWTFPWSSRLMFFGYWVVVGALAV